MGNYIVMWELYEDADALEVHGKSEHQCAAGAGFAGLMETTRNPKAGSHHQIKELHS